MSDTKGDGRNLRALASRNALVKACREAMTAGCWRPPSWVVASLAQRSLRTVYDHFPDMDSLYKEALENEGTRLRLSADLDELSMYQQAFAIVAGEHPQWPTSTTAKRARDQWPAK